MYEDCQLNSETFAVNRKMGGGGCLFYGLFIFPQNNSPVVTPNDTESTNDNELHKWSES